MTQFRIGLVCLALLVSGCAEHWTRPGSDQTDFARVKELCDVRGRDRYPPRLVEETVLSGGGGGGCSAGQHCGTTTNASTVTLDVNQEAREKESRVCLEQNGWTRAR